MLAICIESSHRRGTGHLFRALNLIAYLEERKIAFVVLINDDAVSLQILRKKRIPYETVPLTDLDSGWEVQLIEKYDIRVWVNDRLDTELAHARNVKHKGVRLVTFDDRGGGASLADLHFAGLVFEGAETLKGSKVCRGIDYLVLNREIDKYKRQRDEARQILVTLGGTDTYGVTVAIVEMLAKLKREATLIVGPGFRHHQELRQRLSAGFTLKTEVPSLIAEFIWHDLAITGGGITPFEANASGLPCLTIASEPFEAESCRFLAKLGTSIYLGNRNKLDTSLLDEAIRSAPVSSMSKMGMAKIGTGGAINIVNELEKL